MTIIANKVPLAIAADNFAQVCTAIDEGNLDETIITLFNETRLDLAAAVDRRICFLNMCSSSLETAKAARDAWRDRVKQLEALELKMKNLTLDAVRASGGKQVVGEIGRICLQDSPEALCLEFETFERTITKVIDPNQIEHHGIEDKYLKKYAAYQLDTAKVKEDLQAGANLKWARLTRGQHIRIRS